MYNSILDQLFKCRTVKEFRYLFEHLVRLHSFSFEQSRHLLRCYNDSDRKTLVL